MERLRLEQVRRGIQRTEPEREKKREEKMRERIFGS